MVGRQGGSWDDRFLLPWEETLLFSGFHFGCRQPDAPSTLQGEGGRKRGRNLKVEKEGDSNLEVQ